MCVYVCVFERECVSIFTLKVSHMWVFIVFFYKGEVEREEKNNGRGWEVLLNA